MVPRAALMKTGLRALNTVRPVNTDHPKTTVYSARPMSHFSKSAQSTGTCPIFQTSRNLMEDGLPTSKGTLKTGKLDFEDVYFVKELQFNLLSVSQMCDKNNSVLFTDTECFVLSPNFKLADERQVLLKVPRKNNMYNVDMKNIIPKESLTCLVAKAILDESMLWHRRLGHVNFKTINKLVKENLVRGLPIKHFENDQTCVAYLKGKQHKASCKSKILNSITQPLFMLHIDFFGPTFVRSLMNKMYCLVVTDDYSRFTWVFFLATKDETSGILKSFITEVENLVDKKVKIIRCDNGTKFKNRVMSEFYEKKGIKKEFSIARTPQQNSVAERRNMTLIEAARTIGRTPTLSFMRPFGCHVTILNTLDYLGKFDGKSDKGFYVGYSMNSKAFRVYNIRTRKVEENLHIRFLEDKPIIAGTNFNDSVGTEESVGPCHSSKETGSSQDYILMPIKKDDEGVSKESGIDDQEKPGYSTQDVNTNGPSINTTSTNFNTGSLNINTVSPTVTNAPLEATHADFFDDETELDMSNITTTYPVPSTPNTIIHKDHSLEHVIGDVQSGVQTRRMTNEQGFLSAVYEGKTHEDLHTCLFACFLSQEEPKRIAKALSDSAWVEVIQKSFYSLSYKRNKKDKRGIVIKNKARLVAQGYTQEEGIDYNEVFAPIARIEAIRLFLAYASFMGFMVQSLQGGKSTLWSASSSKSLVYVDDIIFGSTKKELCTEFEKLMHDKFQMSFMGELAFFLGLQVKQKEDGIFISQDKYIVEILKKFSFTDVRTASTPMDTDKPLLKDSDGDDVDVHIYRLMIGSLMYLTSSRPDIMFAVYACARFQVSPKASHLHVAKRIFRYLKGQPKLGLWYPRDSSFDLVAYSDSDYAGASLDRKSTTEGCQFLGCRLISWQCKKQTVVATSYTEAEYVAAASCYGQVLWIQN
ncbi:putative ribonuclease H-like domain-containing protein [Tanacetum coccineum]